MLEVNGQKFSDALHSHRNFLRNLIILGCIYAVSVAGIFYALFFLEDDIGIWQQGGMLVSFADGPVRRGITGSILLALSDMTGMSPVFLSEIVLAALTAAVFACVLVVAWQAQLPDRLLILLISPAFLVMWFTNYAAAMHKSLFIYLAFCLLFFRWRRASILLFGFGVWSHEGMIFFLPLYLLGLQISGAFRIHMAFAALMAIAAFSFALVFPTADRDVLCNALIERGGSADLCRGAIAYTERSFDQALIAVRDKLSGYSRVSFAAAYALALLPVALCLPQRLIVPAFLSGLFFLPLYIIGTDWGRWLAMHVFSVTFLILLAKPQTLYRPLPSWAFAGLVVMCLSYGISHIGAVLGPGVVVTLIQAITALS